MEAQQGKIEPKQEQIQERQTPNPTATCLTCGTFGGIIQASTVFSNTLLPPHSTYSIFQADSTLCIRLSLVDTPRSWLPQHPEVTIPS